jgi:hypothetical protein
MTKFGILGKKTAFHVFTILMNFRQIYHLDKKEGLLLIQLSLLELLDVLIEGYTAVPLNAQVLWILGDGECEVFSKFSENRNA